VKNKSTEKIILLISDFFFTYLEVFVAFFVIFVMITYGIDILQTQKADYFLLQGYMLIISAYVSFFIYLFLAFFIKKILKHNQPKKYVIHLMGAFLSAYIIVVGILDLQTEHFPEENYIYFGSNLIIMGLIGILFAQWRYKKIKIKEGNQS